MSGTAAAAAADGRWLRSNWQGRAACTGHWASNRPSRQTDRQTDAARHCLLPR